MDTRRGILLIIFVLQLTTNEKPFSTVKTGDRAGSKIKKGERPPRPQIEEAFSRGLDNDVWELLVRCWTHDPADRPDMSEVLESLYQCKA
jgi:hypothetical protein